MAFVPKKTYSRRNNDLSVLSEKDKENVDPFDELLSSPLKQEVEFQPLSFWGRKVRRLEFKEKCKKVDCGLFKSSDSDEPNSPCQRKRKHKAKESKPRSLQPKSGSQKLNDRRKTHSTAHLVINRTKSPNPVVKEPVMSTLQIVKNEGWSLDNTLYPNESMEETLKPSCDPFNFKNVNEYFNKADSNNHSHCVRLKINQKKKLSKSHLQENFIKAYNPGFKVYKDTVSEQQFVDTGSKTLNCNNNNVNSTIYFDNSVEETLIHNHGKANGTIHFENSLEESLMHNHGKANGTIHFDNSMEETLMHNHGKANGTIHFDNSMEETLIHNHGEANGTIHFDNSMEETLIPFQSGQDSFKFVTVRRKYFNNPVWYTGSFSESPASNKSPDELWNKSKKTISPINCKTKDVVTPEEFDETLIYCGNILNKETINCSETVGNIFYNEDSFFDLGDLSTLRCYSQNTVSKVNKQTKFDSETLVPNENKSVHTSLKYNDSVDKNLQKVNPTLRSFNADGVVLETGSTSDDTLSSFMDEETVINVRLKAESSDSPLTGTEKNASHPVSNTVSVLSTSMSELSIKNATGSDPPESENDKVGNIPQDSLNEDKEKNLIREDLRNVTTGRGVRNKRCRSSVLGRQSSVPEDAEISWISGRPSMGWNKSFSFVNPVFESTRVFDAGFVDQKRQTKRFEENKSILEETVPGFDGTYILKPGKKWMRSRSVLKQIENGTITGNELESTRITGRKFGSFVQEMLEIQNERSSFFTPLVDKTYSNRTLRGGDVKNAYLNGTKTDECNDLPEKYNFSISSNESILENSSMSHTVKIIQPQDKPSAFRSALNLEDNLSLVQGSVLEESSAISARDFILMQCGQEDVLPFEEYFNERTLENCRKIGEGVYGEVFMCSDTVIKIIPIEGSDKVNGEPQKTFAEIISEVVIASKLSNLRKGKKHRTDGFSEMKRSWCVKGKYPTYLLQLWNEYDEQGSGSENDSPVMFKDDQLYIILELANGGKDLESFVFTSSAQSLSLFIQAAFSLAVAEKSFEFEHRDLHWGNVLISQTKDQFMSVYLDGVEYKIPTKGVKVCIIDFTLSRINHEGCCIFNDLSVDPSLFASEGDYQFEIYRLMLREVKNDWSLFRPKTNIFWLHYTLDKMLKLVRYRNKKAKLHIKHLKDLKSLESVVLEYEDSTDFVLSNPLNDVINKL